MNSYFETDLSYCTVYDYVLTDSSSNVLDKAHKNVHLKFDGVPRVDSILDDSWLPKLHIKGNMTTLNEVGLDKTCFHKYPHEFSGGQRQRISIARAIILKPDIIILDEPTSALDMNTQLQIIELLLKLQISKKLSYIFISRDLKVIKALADNILVMKDGKILEEGDTNTVLHQPKNKYTKSLLQSSLN